MRVAINGFGRIGRNVFRAGFGKGVNIVAVNDLTDTKNLAYLLKHDSVYGECGLNIKFTNNSLIVNGKKILVLSEKDPSKLPWGKLKVDLVVESTGLFRRKDEAMKHIRAGAKKVIISAPSESAEKTIVLGVNEKTLKKTDKVISMASCTTNCLAPVVKVLDDNFGIESGFMTTVHGYTSSQKLVDGPHHKFRRGRAAAVNIIPTTSGATAATALAIPKLKGKIDGLAMRVPVVAGSITDFVVNLKKSVTVEKINKAFKKAAKGSMKGILAYSTDEIVSTDIIGNKHSSIVDGLSTQVIGKKMVKVLSWYDNEWGYSSRMIDLIKYIAKKRLL